MTREALISEFCDLYCRHPRREDVEQDGLDALCEGCPIEILNFKALSPALLGDRIKLKSGTEVVLTELVCKANARGFETTFTGKDERGRDFCFCEEDIAEIRVGDEESVRIAEEACGGKLRIKEVLSVREETGDGETVTCAKCRKSYAKDFDRFCEERTGKLSPNDTCPKGERGEDVL